MFRVHTPIIRKVRCWVTAYGFLHRVFGWVVVLRAAALVVREVRILLYGNIRTAHTTTSDVPDDGRMYLKHVELRIQ